MVLTALELVKRMATDLEFRDRLNGLTDKRELLEQSGFDGVTAADVAPAAASLFRGANNERGVTTSQIEFQSETAPQFAASSAAWFGQPASSAAAFGQPASSTAAIGCVAVGAIRFGQPVAGASRLRQSGRRFNGSKRERRGSAPCRIGGFRLRRVRVKSFRVGALLWPLVWTSSRLSVSRRRWTVWATALRLRWWHRRACQKA